MSPRAQPERAWFGFLIHLREALREVKIRPDLAFKGDPEVPLQVWMESPQPVCRVLRALTVWDALLLEVWGRVDHPTTQVRLCTGCPGVFVVTKVNRGQRYCSRARQARAANAKWYENQRNRERRNARRRKAGGTPRADAAALPTRTRP